MYGYSDEKDSGELSSPNFPGYYGNYYIKSYEIQTSSDPITIYFSHFSTESCCDFVSIEDGDGTVLLQDTSGTSIPANTTSRTNTVYVKFKTDGGVSSSGWKLNWEATTTVINRDPNQFCECCD